MLAQRTLPTDVQYRAFRTKRGSNTGNRIGTARAGGSDHATELPGLAGISVGGVRCGLLVTHVDDTDALVQAAIVNIDDMSAAKREDGVDAFGLECFRDQVPTGDYRSILGFCLQGIRGGIRYRWFFSYS